MSDSAKPRSRKFSPQEDHFILQSFKSGRMTVEIANSLDRNQSSVRGRLRWLIDRDGEQPPEQQCRRWTDEDVRSAHRLYSAGCSYDSIGATIGRSRKSVIAKIRQLLDGDTVQPDDDGDDEDARRVAKRSASAQRLMPSHLPAKRKCLRCGQFFNSAHAGNRICRRCKDSISSLGLPAHLEAIDF